MTNASETLVNHCNAPLLYGLNSMICLSIIAINMTVLLAPWITGSTQTIIWILAIDTIVLRITNLHWHIIHEAAHRSLMPSTFLNECMGQFLSLFLYSSFNALRFGHLTHHQTNRYEDITEVYTERPHHWAYYGEILGGFYYVTEFFGPMISLLSPRSIHRLLDRLHQRMPEKTKTAAAVKRLVSNPKKVLCIRIECIAYLAFFALSLILYRQHLALFLGYFALRALLISYYNNMPHYGNTVKQDVGAADNSYLPAWLSWCYLHFNYHQVHHQYPLAPWITLPALFRKDKKKHDKHFIKAYFKQLKGPIAEHTLRQPVTGY